MKWGNFEMLWLLLVTVPLLALFLWAAWRKRQRLVAQFVQSRLLANLTVGISPVRQRIRIVLLVASVGLILLALAQPQWGFAWEEAKQRGLDILVAIDTSRSMLAEDIPPNRLTRAKLAALDLMKAAKNDRLGLIAFAGSAFLQCPLTLDDEAYRQSVEALEVGIIPQGGTALTEAIQTALAAFKDEGEAVKVLVVFTDGEDHEPGAVEGAKNAAKAGLRIFTIGVGTAEGELLSQKDEKGNLSYVKDETGNVVKSRLNETVLREIAQAANGFYLPLRGAGVIEALYKQGLAPLPKTELSAKRLQRFHERYQWPLGLAILLLILELFLPERKRVRRSETILVAPNAELRKAVALFILIILPVSLIASPSQALRKYQSGEYQEALDEYERLLDRKPDDQRLHFNAGAAAYKSKHYEEAAKNFGAALQSPDIQLQQQSYYNLGNTFYEQGEGISEAPQKIASWEQAVKTYESALKLNSQDADAKHNLEFVKRKLEELRQQQQQEKKSQDKDSDQDKSKEKDQSAKPDQDQNGKPQSSDAQKQEEKKEDQSAQPEKKPGEQPEQKQDESKSAGQDQKQPNKNPENKDDAASSSKEKPAEEGEGDQPDSAVTPGQMTRQQAQQLLDSQKGEEKVLMFIPKEKAKQKNRIFKDW